MKKILIILALLIALFLIVGVILPGEYAVERSIAIEAPAETVYDQVNDLKKNRNWSPWEETDETAEFSYGTTYVGVGAWYDWQGEEVGKGRLTITNVEPNRRVDTALAFGDYTTARATFTFVETAEGTEATWRVEGDYGKNLLARYLGFVIRGVIAENFERGLANLKRVAEEQARLERQPEPVPAPAPPPQGEPAPPPQGEPAPPPQGEPAQPPTG